MGIGPLLLVHREDQMLRGGLLLLLGSGGEHCWCTSSRSALLRSRLRTLLGLLRLRKQALGDLGSTGGFGLRLVRRRRVASRSSRSGLVLSIRWLWARRVPGSALGAIVNPGAVRAMRHVESTRKRTKTRKSCGARVLFLDAIWIHKNVVI